MRFNDGQEADDYLNHEIIDEDIEGCRVGGCNVRKVREFLYANDRVEDVGLEALGDEVSDQDCASERQDVLDLPRQLAHDHRRRNRVRGGAGKCRGANDGVTCEGQNIDLRRRSLHECRRARLRSQGAAPPNLIS